MLDPCASGKADLAVPVPLDEHQVRKLGYADSRCCRQSHHALLKRHGLSELGLLITQFSLSGTRCLRIATSLMWQPRPSVGPIMPPPNTGNRRNITSTSFPGGMMEAVADTILEDRRSLNMAGIWEGAVR